MIGEIKDMLKLLFIEDQPDSVQPAIDALNARNCACELRGFEDVENALKEFSPDAVILDILDDGSTPEPKAVGISYYDLIWNTRFCPIVVYSAQPDLISDQRDPHPFVNCVKKGRDVQQLVKSIEEFRPHIEAVRDAETMIKREFAHALRDVAPDAFRIFKDAQQRNGAILRSARRRLAALMDDLSRHGEQLRSWEQYLSPPVSADIQLGDILRKRDGSKDDPASFVIVLTPSCDLVASGGRSSKVDNVLVACCCKTKEALATTSLKEMSERKLKERLQATVLTQGYFEGIIPFPRLEGRIPTMAANLKQLRLVPVDSIGADAEYKRVASIDSPFRELIAWAYLQVACRPGLPDRDFKSWRDEVMEVWKTDH